MAKIIFLTWDGGGNVAVTLGIGLALRKRGDSVTILGPRSIRDGIERLGLRWEELGILPPRDPGQRLRYLLDVTQGTDAMRRQLPGLIADSDAVVVDCNLAWALQSIVGIPTVVLVHTALSLYVPVWQQVLDAANADRAEAGLPLLAAAAEEWARHELLLVASLESFDRPVPTSDLRPVYVGPVASPRPGPERPFSLPPGAGPRVLVTYSTDALQNSPERLQTALDALADLPVSTLASTSGLYPIDRLRVPHNAFVLDFLPHESVLAAVDVIVCHAGHGTVMAALTHGVPLVCVPGLGRDQVPISARASELGLGVALERDASSAAIRDAVSTVVADPGYAERARAFADRSGRPDGAQRAANVIGALLEGAA